MAKRTKHSTQSKLVTNKPIEREFYYNTLAHQLAPSNGQHKIRVAHAIVEWSNNLKEPATIEDFIDTQGIHPDTFYEWIKKCPELKEAHQYAKRRVANMRLQKGTSGQWNWNACKWYLTLMEKQYLEHEKTLNAIKTDAPLAGEHKVTIVERPVFILKDGQVVKE